MGIYLHTHPLIVPRNIYSWPCMWVYIISTHPSSYCVCSLSHSTPTQTNRCHSCTAKTRKEFLTPYGSKLCSCGTVNTNRKWHISAEFWERGYFAEGLCGRFYTSRCGHVVRDCGLYKLCPLLHLERQLGLPWGHQQDVWCRLDKQPPWSPSCSITPLHSVCMYIPLTSVCITVQCILPLAVSGEPKPFQNPVPLHWHPSFPSSGIAALM